MSKQVVVTITKSHVIAERIDDSAKDPVLAREVLAWKPGDLESAFLQVISAFPKADRVRVMLSEGLCHVVGFQVEKKQANDRSVIQTKAAEMLLEDLHTIRWDYEVVSEEGEYSNIQVLCLTKLIDDELSELESRKTVTIEAILPVSVLLLESFVEKDASFIHVYSDEVVRTISVVKSGVVVYATDFETKGVGKKVVQVLEFAHKFLQFDSRMIVTTGIETSELKAVQAEYKIEPTELLAAANMVRLKRIKGPDRKVLNITLSKTQSSLLDEVLSVSSSAQTSSGPFGKKAFFLLFLILIGLAGIFAGYWIVQSR